ncbi:hypothetical protein ACSSS7_000100 [Eimeria intestinalis]
MPLQSFPRRDDEPRGCRCYGVTWLHWPLAAAVAVVAVAAATVLQQLLLHEHKRSVTTLRVVHFYELQDNGQKTLETALMVRGDTGQYQIVAASHVFPPGRSRLSPTAAAQRQAYNNNNNSSSSSSSSGSNSSRSGSQDGESLPSDSESAAADDRHRHAALQDRRLMAASDLTQAIVSDPGGLGSAWESTAATAFLQQLGDTSIDVQANAVRCVSRVLLYFLPESVRLILEIHTSPSGLLPELPRSMASTVVTVVLPPLIKGVRSDVEGVQQDCLELLADVFSLFNSLNEVRLFDAAAAKDAQLSVHLTQLLHAKLPTARRAARCLGGLAACLPLSKLEELLLVLVSASPLTPAPLEALGEVCRCCSSSSSRSSSSKSHLVQFLNPLCCYLTQVLARVLAAEAAASGGSGSVAAAAAAAAHAADAAKAALAAATAADTSSSSSSSRRLEQHIPAEVVLPRGATPETLREQREELLEAALAALAAAARVCCCAAAATSDVFAATQPLLLPLLSYNPNVYTADTPEQQQQQQQQELKQLLLLQQQPRDQQLVLQLLQTKDTDSSSSSSSGMEDLDFDPGVWRVHTPQVVAAELASPTRRFPALAKSFVAPLVARLERDEHCIVLQVIELLRRFVRAAATSSPLVLQCETALLLEALHSPTAAAAQQQQQQQQQQYSHLLRPPELRTGSDELQKQMPFLVLRACRLCLDDTLGFKVQQASAMLLLEAAATFAAAAAPLLPLLLAAADGLLHAEASAIIIYAFQLQQQEQQQQKQQQEEEQQLQQELLQRQLRRFGGSLSAPGGHPPPLAVAAAAAVLVAFAALKASRQTPAAAPAPAAAASATAACCCCCRCAVALAAASCLSLSACSQHRCVSRGVVSFASEALRAISQQLHTADAEGPVLEADLYAFGALMRCYGSLPDATAAAGDAWGRLLYKLEGTGLRKAALSSLLMILEAEPPVQLEALLPQPPSASAAATANAAVPATAAAARAPGGAAVAECREMGGLQGLATLLAATVLQQQQQQHLRAIAARCLLLLLERHPALLQEAEQQLNVVRLLQLNEPVPAATGLRHLLLLLQQPQQQQQQQVVECLLQQCLPAAVALVHAQPLPQQTLGPLCLFFEALCPPQANICSQEDIIQRLLSAAKPGAPEGSLQAAAVIASRLLQQQAPQQAPSKLLSDLKQQQQLLLQKQQQHVKQDQQQLHQQGQQELPQLQRDTAACLQLSFFTYSLAECARSASCPKFVSEALSCCLDSLNLHETDVQQHAAAAVSRILSGHGDTCLARFLLLLQQQRQQVLQAEEAEARTAAACNNDQEPSVTAAAAAEAPVAANSAPAGDTAMQRERDDEQQQQKQQELAAAKANTKQERARELLLVSALYGCLLETDKQQQPLQHWQSQRQGQQQQQQQGSEPFFYLGKGLSELVSVLSLLATSRSERERTIVAECLILLTVRCGSSNNSSSCCCSKKNKSSSWCDRCSSIHAALLSLLKSDNPEQKLTALASLRDAAAREMVLPATLKPAFLQCMESNDLRVQRAALLTLGSTYTSTHSSVWGWPAEADDLATHLLRAVEVREELITQINMGPFKHKIDNGIRLRKTAFVSLTQMARAAAAAAAAAGSTTPAVPLATLVQAVARGIVDPSDEVQPLACELLSTVAEYIHCWKPLDVARQVASLSGAVELALSSVSALCLSEQSTKNPQAAERARENLRCICRSVQQLRERLQSEGYSSAVLEESARKAEAKTPGLHQLWGALTAP